MFVQMTGGEAAALIAQGAYAAGPDQLEPDRTYTVVANEQISPPDARSARRSRPSPGSLHGELGVLWDRTCP
jgi:hypothetical protein